jgi:large subunit ribosomal protein L23
VANSAQIEKWYDLIKSGHITEKTVNNMESGNVYTFKVKPQATKNQLKSVVEQFFNVKVLKVRTVNVLGKIKNFKQKSGRCQDWKKAYVTLPEGAKIDFSEFVLS